MLHQAPGNSKETGQEKAKHTRGLCTVGQCEAMLLDRDFGVGISSIMDTMFQHINCLQHE